MEKQHLFETKNVCEFEFHDYRNLKNNPLYVKLVKSITPVLWIDYENEEGLTKIDGLQAFKWFLDKNGWAFQKRYFTNICKHLQSELNMPPE